MRAIRNKFAFDGGMRLNEHAIECLSDLTVIGAQQEHLFGRTQGRAGHVLPDVFELHALLENPVLVHDVDRDLSMFVGGAGFSEDETASWFQRASEAGHGSLAIGHMVKAFIAEDRVCGTAANRQVFDVGDDQMRAIHAHPLDANLEVRPADVHADRFNPRFVRTTRSSTRSHTRCRAARRRS